MKQTNFGSTKDNKAVTLTTIENEKISISVMDRGATLVSFIDKQTGIDIVQGFDSVCGYEELCPYMGATIGRVCNRIAKGEFSLVGKIYHTYINNGPNTLHGGQFGFDQKLFTLKCEGHKLIYSYLSVDQEEGFPGNLKLEVCYELLSDGLAISTKASCDQETICAITNHSFFNLDESETILDHELKVNAHKFAHVDKDGLTLEEIENVKDTPFDFMQFHTIGERINDDNPQLKNGSGYDHHFLVDGEGLRTMAELKGHKLTMTVLSTLPGFHLYSSNYLDDKCLGKKGRKYPRRSSICFETQYLPNSINMNSQCQPILKPGEVQTHRTEFHLGEEKRAI